MYQAYSDLWGKNTFVYQPYYQHSCHQWFEANKILCSMYSLHHWFIVVIALTIDL